VAADAANCCRALFPCRLHLRHRLPTAIRTRPSSMTVAQNRAETLITCADPSISAPASGSPPPPHLGIDTDPHPHAIYVRRRLSPTPGWITCRRLLLPCGVSRLSAPVLERLTAAHKPGGCTSSRPGRLASRQPSKQPRPAKRKWVVYAKRPFGDPTLSSLPFALHARIAIAIAGCRLDGSASLQMKDYGQARRRYKLMTLDATSSSVAS